MNITCYSIAYVHKVYELKGQICVCFFCAEVIQLREVVTSLTVNAFLMAIISSPKTANDWPISICNHFYSHSFSIFMLFSFQHLLPRRKQFELHFSKLFVWQTHLLRWYDKLHLIGNETISLQSIYLWLAVVPKIE